MKQQTNNSSSLSYQCMELLNVEDNNRKATLQCIKQQNHTSEHEFHWPSIESLRCGKQSGDSVNA